MKLFGIFKKIKKVVILDFDGTFYTGENIFDKIPAYIKRHKREFFPRISDADYERILKENPEFKNIYHGSDVVGSMFLFKRKYPELDISAKDFWDFQNSKPDPLVLENAAIVNAELMCKVCKKYPVYIVSNSSPTHVKFYLQKFGIEPEWFSEIISNKFTVKDKSKKHYYRNILQKEKVDPSQIVVMGDNFKNDIEPALELGMNAFKIESVCQFEKLLKKL